jgi:hypothetical protein
MNMYAYLCTYAYIDTSLRDSGQGVFGLGGELRCMHTRMHALMDACECMYVCVYIHTCRYQYVMREEEHVIPAALIHT